MSFLNMFGSGSVPLEIATVGVLLLSPDALTGHDSWCVGQASSFLSQMRKESEQNPAKKPAFQKPPEDWTSRMTSFFKILVSF